MNNIEAIGENWQPVAKFFIDSICTKTLTDLNTSYLKHAIMIHKKYKAHKQKSIINVWADAAFFNQFKFEAYLMNGN